MKQKFQRVFDASGALIDKLYLRIYSNAKGRAVKRYYAIFTDWQHIRRRIPLGEGLSLQQAIKKLGDVEKKNANEVDFDEAKGRSIALGKWADECASAMRERDTTLLPHLTGYFKNKALRLFTDKDILDYRATREAEPVIKRGKATKKKTSPTTVNKEVALLRKLMRLALSKGIVRKLPKFVQASEPSRERTLTAEEYEALKEKSPLWFRRLVIASNGTCLNIGDLINLTWDEVDRKTWIISIRGGRNKTGVKQQVPIREPELKALFDELDVERKKLENISNLVFTKDGQRIYYMQQRRALQRAMKDAKIQNFTTHDFRHCAISRWHTMKVPAEAAMRMSGQSSIASFKKYINMDAQQVAQVFTSCLQEISEPTKKPVSA